MKKYLLVFLSILFLTILFPARAVDAQPIGVFVDGLPVISDTSPIIQSGRVMVPFRAVAESLNAKVDWNPDLQTVTASQGENTIKLQIGNNTAWNSDGEIILDVPPMIIQNRTLIPLRFFAEELGCQVSWDGATYEVKISSPQKKMTITGFYALGDSRTSSWTSIFGKPFPELSAGNTDIIGELALGWYSVDAEGNLLTKSSTGWQRPDSWEKVVEAAEAFNIKYDMVVHVTEKGNTITKMMSNDAAVEQFVSSVLSESQEYDGVNLDFEGLGLGADSSEDRQMFTVLVNRLYSALQPRGKTLTLTLHAPNSSYKGYDYEKLGAVSDQIIIMAYDYGPQPEPDQMVIQAVEMALKEVPAHKLILGVSLPSETPESLTKRIGIAKKYGLKGIAIWRLGLVSESSWQVMREGILPRN
ncbi:MAG: copper amine oxidase [Syntrophomonadaceae bacterium]|nr:copper amine oxidase [Syntrophomonadaceae bacterium]